MPEVHREPVLGIHDLAPPEGRVTVELLNERGTKVVQRSRGENAVMNWWTDVMKRNIRGDGLIQAGYSFHGLTQEQTFGTLSEGGLGGTTLHATDWYTYHMTSQPLLVHPRLYSTAQSLILTDSTLAVSADEIMFPGDVTAMCYLPETYGGTMLKRGGLILSGCQRTPTTLRYQAEWGTTFANGTINSVGIGQCEFVKSTGAPANLAFACPNLGLANHVTVPVTWPESSDGALNASSNLWAWISTLRNAWGASTTASGGVTSPHMSGHRVSNAEYWVVVSGVAGNNVTKLDLSTGITTAPFTAFTAASGVAVTGPTMTTVGAATNRCGVTVTGSDLWLAYGTTLKRCAKPTNTTLSVTNTYAPAGVGTLVDITTDGTNLYWLDATKVWVISAATGAVTSSWTHSLPGTMHNICYVGTPVAQEGLLISYFDTTTAVANYMSAAAAATGAQSPERVDRFTLAGTRHAGWAFSYAITTSSNASFQSSGVVMPISGDNRHFVGAHGGNNAFTSNNVCNLIHPSHVSRTVLGAPVVKTAANSLRCIYEYGF